MREILFRAKTLKDVRWIYGDLMRSGTDPDDGEYDIMYWDDESGWMSEHIDPKTIGQYTGYQDSMNVRIFEGDIVNVHMHEYDMVGRFFTKTDFKPYYRALVSYNERTCKEIYEGDIIKSTDYPFMDNGNVNYLGIVSCDTHDAIGEFFVMLYVTKESGRRGISNYTNKSFYDLQMENVEVVGNIHDDPKLLNHVVQ